MVAVEHLRHYLLVNLESCCWQKRKEEEEHLRQHLLLVNLESWVGEEHLRHLQSC